MFCLLEVFPCSSAMNENGSQNFDLIGVDHKSNPVEKHPASTRVRFN